MAEIGGSWRIVTVPSVSTLLTLFRFLGNTGAVQNARHAAAARTHEEEIVAALAARLEEAPAALDTEPAASTASAA